MTMRLVVLILCSLGKRKTNYSLSELNTVRSIIVLMAMSRKYPIAVRKTFGWNLIKCQFSFRELNVKTVPGDCNEINEYISLVCAKKLRRLNSTDLLFVLVSLQKKW